MCTSIVVNNKKTIVGFNLDLLDMKHRVTPTKKGVYIEIFDKTEGWMPIFGANNRGDFIAMPTCWPFDQRSNGTPNDINIINLDIDLLLEKKTFNEVIESVKNNKISSVNGITFQAQLSDKNGNVLQIVPGQGYNYLERPNYKVMTNFSPFKQDKEKHPWMGYDRYLKVTNILNNSGNDFDVKEMFDLLKESSQTVCPTVVSMVLDASSNTVYWCEDRQFDIINKQKLV